MTQPTSSTRHDKASLSGWPVVSRALTACTTWALLLLPAACSGSAARFGALSGDWVLIGNQVELGVAAAPEHGAPLQLRPAAELATGCLTDRTLHDHFGDTCVISETEGGAAQSYGDGEVLLGPNPTQTEVRWYCDQRSVVRLIVTRCPGTDSFRVTQLALSLRAH